MNLLKKTGAVALIAFVFLSIPIISWGQTGNCLDFDGLNDRVFIDDMADDMATSTVFSIEFAVKGVATLQHNQAALVSVNTASGGNTVLIVMGQAGTIHDGKIHVFDGASVAYEISSAFIGDDAWHTIRYERTGTTASLYIDGAFVGSHTPDYVLAADDKWSIGQEWDGGSPSDHFEGQIDDLIIHNGATIEGQYNFNQGTAGGNNTGLTTLLDSSPNANNGSLFNFVLTGSISNWVAASAAMPVEFLSFELSKKSTSILLTWQTAQEINNRGFEIEHSEDGKQWKTIGYEQGAGSSTNLKEYQYMDDNPFDGINYYRLKQLDFDGQFEYSPIVSISLEKGNNRMVWPNPANEFIILDGVFPDYTICEIYNAAGHLEMQVTLGANRQIDISQLDGGIHYAKIVNDGILLTYTFTKH